MHNKRSKCTNDHHTHTKKIKRPQRRPILAAAHQHKSPALFGAQKSNQQHANTLHLHRSRRALSKQFEKPNAVFAPPTANVFNNLSFITSLSQNQRHNSGTFHMASSALQYLSTHQQQTSKLSQVLISRFQSRIRQSLSALLLRRNVASTRRRYISSSIRHSDHQEDENEDSPHCFEDCLSASDIALLSSSSSQQMIKDLESNPHLIAEDSNYDRIAALSDFTTPREFSPDALSHSVVTFPVYSESYIRHISPYINRINNSPSFVFQEMVRISKSSQRSNDSNTSQTHTNDDFNWSNRIPAKYRFLSSLSCLDFTTPLATATADPHQNANPNTNQPYFSSSRNLFPVAFILMLTMRQHYDTREFNTEYQTIENIFRDIHQCRYDSMIERVDSLAQQGYLFVPLLVAAICEQLLISSSEQNIISYVDMAPRDNKNHIPGTSHMIFTTNHLLFTLRKYGLPLHPRIIDVILHFRAENPSAGASLQHKQLEHKPQDQEHHQKEQSTTDDVSHSPASSNISDDINTLFHLYTTYQIAPSQHTFQVLFSHWKSQNQADLILSCAPQLRTYGIGLNTALANTLIWANIQRQRHKIALRLFFFITRETSRRQNLLEHSRSSFFSQFCHQLTSPTSLALSSSTAESSKSQSKTSLPSSENSNPSTELELDITDYSQDDGDDDNFSEFYTAHSSLQEQPQEQHQQQQQQLTIAAHSVDIYSWFTAVQPSSVTSFYLLSNISSKMAGLALDSQRIHRQLSFFMLVLTNPELHSEFSHTAFRWYSTYLAHYHNIAGEAGHLVQITEFILNEAFRSQQTFDVEVFNVVLQSYQNMSFPQMSQYIHSFCKTLESYNDQLQQRISDFSGGDYSEKPHNHAAGSKLAQVRSTQRHVQSLIQQLRTIASENQTKNSFFPSVEQFKGVLAHPSGNPSGKLGLRRSSDGGQLYEAFWIETQQTCQFSKEDEHHVENVLRLTSPDYQVNPSEKLANHSSINQFAFSTLFSRIGMHVTTFEEKAMYAKALSLRIPQSQQSQFGSYSISQLVTFSSLYPNIYPNMTIFPANYPSEFTRKHLHDIKQRLSSPGRNSDSSSLLTVIPAKTQDAQIPVDTSHTQTTQQFSALWNSLQRLNLSAPLFSIDSFLESISARTDESFPSNWQTTRKQHQLNKLIKTFYSNVVMLPCTFSDPHSQSIIEFGPALSPLEAQNALKTIFSTSKSNVKQFTHLVQSHRNLSQPVDYQDENLRVAMLSFPRHIEHNDTSTTTSTSIRFNPIALQYGVFDFYMNLLTSLACITAGNLIPRPVLTTSPKKRQAIAAQISSSSTSLSSECDTKLFDDFDFNLHLRFGTSYVSLQDISTSELKSAVYRHFEDVISATDYLNKPPSASLTTISDDPQQQSSSQHLSPKEQLRLFYDQIGVSPFVLTFLIHSLTNMQYSVKKTADTMLYQSKWTKTTISPLVRQQLQDKSKLQEMRTQLVANNDPLNERGTIVAGNKYEELILELLVLLQKRSADRLRGKTITLGQQDQIAMVKRAIDAYHLDNTKESDDIDNDLSSDESAATPPLSNNGKQKSSKKQSGSKTQSNSSDQGVDGDDDNDIAEEDGTAAADGDTAHHPNSALPGTIGKTLADAYQAPDIILSGVMSQIAKLHSIFIELEDHLSANAKRALRQQKSDFPDLEDNVPHNNMSTSLQLSSPLNRHPLISNINDDMMLSSPLSHTEQSPHERLLQRLQLFVQVRVALANFQQNQTKIMHDLPVPSSICEFFDTYNTFSAQVATLLNETARHASNITHDERHSLLGNTAPTNHSSPVQLHAKQRSKSYSFLKLYMNAYLASDQFQQCFDICGISFETLPVSTSEHTLGAASYATFAYERWRSDTASFQQEVPFRGVFPDHMRRFLRKSSKASSIVLGLKPIAPYLLYDAQTPTRYAGITDLLDFPPISIIAACIVPVLQFAQRKMQGKTTVAPAASNPKLASKQHSNDVSGSNSSDGNVVNDTLATDNNEDTSAPAISHLHAHALLDFVIAALTPPPRKAPMHVHQGHQSNIHLLFEEQPQILGDVFDAYNEAGLHSMTVMAVNHLYHILGKSALSNRIMTAYSEAVMRESFKSITLSKHIDHKIIQSYVQYRSKQDKAKQAQEKRQSESQEQPLPKAALSNQTVQHSGGKFSRNLPPPKKTPSKAPPPPAPKVEKVGPYVDNQEYWLDYNSPLAQLHKYSSTSYADARDLPKSVLDDRQAAFGENLFFQAVPEQQQDPYEMIRTSDPNVPGFGISFPIRVRPQSGPPALSLTERRRLRRRMKDDSAELTPKAPPAPPDHLIETTVPAPTASDIVFDSMALLQAYFERLLQMEQLPDESIVSKIVSSAMRLQQEELALEIMRQISPPIFAPIGTSTGLSQGVSTVSRAHSDTKLNKKLLIPSFSSENLAQSDVLWVNADYTVAGFSSIPADESSVDLSSTSLKAYRTEAIDAELSPDQTMMSKWFAKYSMVDESVPPQNYLSYAKIWTACCQHGLLALGDQTLSTAWIRRPVHFQALFSNILSKQQACVGTNHSFFHEFGALRESLLQHNPLSPFCTVKLIQPSTQKPFAPQSRLHPPSQAEVSELASIVPEPSISDLRIVPQTNLMQMAQDNAIVPFFAWLWKNAVYKYRVVKPHASTYDDIMWDSIRCRPYPTDYAITMRNNPQAYLAYATKLIATNSLIRVPRVEYLYGDQHGISAAPRHLSYDDGDGRKLATALRRAAAVETTDESLQSDHVTTQPKHNLIVLDMSSDESELEGLPPLSAEDRAFMLEQLEDLYILPTASSPAPHKQGQSSVEDTKHEVQMGQLFDSTMKYATQSNVPDRNRQLDQSALRNTLTFDVSSHLRRVFDAAEALPVTVPSVTEWKQMESEIYNYTHRRLETQVKIARALQEVDKQAAAKLKHVVRTNTDDTNEIPSQAPTPQKTFGQVPLSLPSLHALFFGVAMDPKRAHVLRRFQDDVENSGIIQPPGPKQKSSPKSAVPLPSLKLPIFTHIQQFELSQQNLLMSMITSIDDPSVLTYGVMRKVLKSLQNTTKEIVNAFRETSSLNFQFECNLPHVAPLDIHEIYQAYYQRVVEIGQGSLAQLESHVEQIQDVLIRTNLLPERLGQDGVIDLEVFAILRDHVDKAENTQSYIHRQKLFYQQHIADALTNASSSVSPSQDEQIQESTTKTPLQLLLDADDLIENQFQHLTDRPAPPVVIHPYAFPQSKKTPIPKNLDGKSLKQAFAQISTLSQTSKNALQHYVRPRYVPVDTAPSKLINHPISFSNLSSLSLQDLDLLSTMLTTKRRQLETFPELADSLFCPPSKPSSIWQSSSVPSAYIPTAPHTHQTTSTNAQICFIQEAFVKAVLHIKSLRYVVDELNKRGNHRQNQIAFARVKYLKNIPLMVHSKTWLSGIQTPSMQQQTSSSSAEPSSDRKPYIVRDQTIIPRHLLTQRERTTLKDPHLVSDACYGGGVDLFKLFLSGASKGKLSRFDNASPTVDVISSLENDTWAFHGEDEPFVKSGNRK